MTHDATQDTTPNSHSPRLQPPGPPLSAGLEVRHEHHRALDGDVDVLSLTGDLDLQGVIELRRQLPPHLAHLLPTERSVATADVPAGGRSSAANVHRVAVLVADLAGVVFLDSAGVGGLISLHRRLQEAQGRLAVCCLQAQPRQVLAVTAADKVLSVHPTLAGALRSPHPSPPAAPSLRPAAAGPPSVA